MEKCTDAPEMWKPVRGFEGYYEVSDRGHVRGVDRWITDAIGRRRFFAARPMCRSVNPRTGRYQVNLCIGSRNRSIPVYRLVIEAFRGPRPAPGMEACHNDGDRTNDRLDNLRWDTATENRRDTVRHGRNEWANRTHCPRKHVLQHPNLVLSNIRLAEQRGARHRTCLACNRARSTVKRAAERGDLIELTDAADAHYARIMGAH